MMKKQRTIYQILGMAMAVFVMIFLPSCDDENAEDAITEEEMENWEPYDLKANTSYDYDFEITEEGNESSSGSAHIKVGDPEVEISGTFNGEEFSNSHNMSEEISENFISAISMTPLAGFMYQPMWMGAFAGQEVRVGASWTYSYGGSSINFNVTGKETYAGHEGFVIITTMQDSNTEESVEWISCITSELPLPLMTQVTHSDGEKYYMELTNYEEL